MLRISPEELTIVGQAIFEAAGVPEETASVVADSLVRANLVGCDSHGVIRIPQYVHMLREGVIRPHVQPSIVFDSPVIAAIDGGWGFGQLAGRLAARVAAAKAAAQGVSVVTVRSCNHLGRIGAYPEMVAQDGMIGLVFANCPTRDRARVAPFGGTRARLAPNVIAVAAPRSSSAEPFLLDMTCSVIPEGKVRVALHRGTCLPEGAALDAQGLPTTDPAGYYGPPEGVLLPLGGPAGHKGYGLLLVCELLAGALGGAGCSGDDDILQEGGNGIFLLAANPASFGPVEEFSRRVEGLFKRVKECPTAPGVEEVLIPGELEAKTAQQRREEGIPLEDETWRQIQEAAAKVGCSEEIFTR